MKNAIILGAFIGFSALAGNNQQQGGSATNELTFDQFKVACQDPARFHNQVAPTNIQISCNDVQYKWVPSVDGSYTMPTARYVTTSLVSDKYTVGAQTAAIKCTDQVGSCPRYKQVAETVGFVRSVSCDEVVAYPGTAIDFCTTMINDLRGANQNAVTLSETGKSIDLCGGAGHDQGQGQGQKR